MAEPNPPKTRPGLLAAATATAAFTAALIVYGLWPEEEGRSVLWSDLSAETGALTIARETKRVFRDSEQLKEYFAAVGGRAPSVDLEHRQLLLVSPGPRSSTGYSLEVSGVHERGGKLTVTVRERSPRLGARVEPRVTFPYRLLSLPAGKDVYVDWRGR